MEVFSWYFEVQTFPLLVLLSLAEVKCVVGYVAVPSKMGGAHIRALGAYLAVCVFGFGTVAGR